MLEAASATAERGAALDAASASQRHVERLERLLEDSRVAQARAALGEAQAVETVRQQQRESPVAQASAGSGGRGIDEATAAAFAALVASRDALAQELSALRHDGAAGHAHGESTAEDSHASGSRHAGGGGSGSSSGAYSPREAQAAAVLATEARELLQRCDAIEEAAGGPPAGRQLRPVGAQAQAHAEAKAPARARATGSV